jgi:hypothetical protein
MKRLIGIILLLGLVYGGYTFYVQSNSSKISTLDPVENHSNSLIINQASDKIGAYASVLGASIGGLLEDGQVYLSDVTKGKSEPIINDLVNKTTEALKDLPRKEAEKIKYEFCKGVVTEYEATK